MKRILISGFGIFGDYRSNLSQTVAENLDGKVICGYEVRSLIFPARISEQNRGEIIFRVADLSRASGIISLGMASDKRGLCLETKTRNLFRNEKYCPRELFGKPIDPTRAIGEELKMGLHPWNVGVFFQKCRIANLVTEISDDCGGFCCNQLAYQARVLQLDTSAGGETPFIYFHIPCAQEDIPDLELFNEQGKVMSNQKLITDAIEILLTEAIL